MFVLGELKKRWICFGTSTVFYYLCPSLTLILRYKRMKKLIYTLLFVLISVAANGQQAKYVFYF
ncbi:hypothetical protein GAO02_12080, partial [Bacteroides thetaiotaomicron]